MISDHVAAVWLDRDGTLNVKAPEGEYIMRPEQLHLLPGAARAVARLNRRGIPVAVVTNQRGVARRRMSSRDLDAVHRRLRDLLASEDAHLDAILACPHEQGVCDCRKPAPGLILAAAATLGITQLDTTVMIGDAESDVEAGRAASAGTIRLASPAVQSAADLHAPDLLAAVDRLLDR